MGIYLNARNKTFILFSNIKVNIPAHENRKTAVAGVKRVLVYCNCNLGEIAGTLFVIQSLSMLQLQLPFFQPPNVYLQLTKFYKMTVNYPNLGEINRHIWVNLNINKVEIGPNAPRQTTSVI